MAEVEVDLTDVLACGYCGAPVGQPCRTKRGRLADRPHAFRIIWHDEDVDDG